MESNEIQKITEQIIELERIAKQYMTKQAIQRYGNLKIAHPEVAVKAIAAIAQAAQLGQIQGQLDDEDFKRLLIEIQKDKKNFTFRR
ncbi:MAG: DNA-binding protein [Candidatus Pacearchaeota archaeon]